MFQSIKKFFSNFLAEEELTPIPGKYLLLMRVPNSNDVFNITERGLTAEGIFQSKNVGYTLRGRKLFFEKAFISPRKRSIEAYRLIKKVMKKCPEANIEKNFFYARLEDMLHSLKSGVIECDSALVISHLPDLRELTEYLTGEMKYLDYSNIALLLPKNEGTLLENIKKKNSFKIDCVLQ